MVSDLAIPLVIANETATRRITALQKRMRTTNIENSSLSSSPRHSLADCVLVPIDNIIPSFDSPELAGSKAQETQLDRLLSLRPQCCVCDGGLVQQLQEDGLSKALSLIISILLCLFCLASHLTAGISTTITLTAFS